MQLEIKAFLERFHGMKVERVHTMNYMGKRHDIMDDTGMVGASS